MEQLNLPPFYPRQRVIATKTVTSTDGNIIGVVKGSQYIVLSVKKSECCGHWLVDVGVPSALPKSACGKCKKYYKSESNWLFGKSVFIPIEENFQSISLEKILEEETKFVSVN